MSPFFPARALSRFPAGVSITVYPVFLPLPLSLALTLSSLSLSLSFSRSFSPSLVLRRARSAIPHLVILPLALRFPRARTFLAGHSANNIHASTVQGQIPSANPVGRRTMCPDAIAMTRICPGGANSRDPSFLVV